MWLADMIKEHACGFVVPPDDPAAFADALEEAAAERLTQLGRFLRATSLDELPEFMGTEISRKNAQNSKDASLPISAQSPFR